MGKPDPPQPVNPIAAAGAQTGTNVSTSIANAFLNNTNQVTPTGNLTYNQTDSYSWVDPSTGQTFQVPRFTVTQTLSPTQQAIQGQTEAAQFNLAGMANAQSGRVSNLLSSEIDYSGVPQGGNAQNIAGVPAAATSYDQGGPVQNQINGTWDVTRDYGPADNFSADRQRVENALYDRLNPQLQRERGNIEQRLADQGIRYGSAAYSAAMDDYNRQANDMRLAVTAQGGQEQQRLNQMEAQRAAFQNTAQQMGYEQALGSGTFFNQAQAQLNQQNALAAQFGNQGLAQQMQQQQAAFNAAQAARNQAMQETYAARNQPINEITALLSGSQVSQPNFINAPQSQIPTTDVAGLMNTSFNQQMGNYQQQMNNWNSTMGGIMGLGAGMLMRSDRRVKENIKKIGTVFAFDEEAEKRGLPIYEYDYKDTKQHGVGPMAQDVEKIDRGAVREIRGVKHIDPTRVMGNILRAA